MERKAEIAHRCLLLDKSEIARGWHLFELEAPLLACAEPGQFVHLRTGCSSDPLLRRPISIPLRRCGGGAHPPACPGVWARHRPPGPEQPRRGAGPAGPLWTGLPLS